MKALSIVLFFSLALPAFGFIKECPLTWNVTNEANAATAATATKSAVTGKRLMIDCAIGTLGTNGNAQTPIHLQLKEGSTVRMTFAVAQPATDAREYGACGLGLIMAASTAATLAFDTNNVAASLSTVNLTGCTIP